MSIHSRVPNAGQKYASARKRGADPAVLSTLKADVNNRDRKDPSETDAADAEALRRSIETRNQGRRH